ncbi:MAG: TonB family protein [Bacteroidota bacterium]
MFSYILQVTLCWTAFYVLYRSLLRKETFFHINRWYLLGTLVMGLLIPLIDWQPSPAIEGHPTYETTIQPIQVQMWQLEQSIEAASQPFAIDFMDVLLAVYLSGVCFFFALLLHGLWKIWRLYRISEVEQQGNIKVVYTPEAHLPFSFFHLLFWSKAHEAALAEKAQILRHEEAHIYQWHTLDVLFLELLNIVFWCSPILYFYRKSLRTTHEYLADALVLENTKRKEYGHLLLKQSLSGVQIALANHFIHSQLKDRILMMTRNKSRKRNLMKYLPLLPILLLAVLVFAKHDGLEQTETMIGSLASAQVADSELIQFINPVRDRSKITKEVGYGMREHPIHKDQRLHTGIDYVVPMRTEIIATADGKVAAVNKWKKGYGHHLEVQHSDGYTTFYAHLDEMLVEIGQPVSKGEVIALSGSTGTSTGPHLHYEVRLNGKAINSATLQQPATDVQKGYFDLGAGLGRAFIYDEQRIANNFAAAFYSDKLSLADRSAMLTEDYQLFTERFAAQAAEITDLLIVEVAKRGLEVQITPSDKTVTLKSQVIKPEHSLSKGELVKVVFKPSMSEKDLENLQSNLKLQGIDLQIEKAEYDDAGRLINLKYEMSDGSGSSMSQWGAIKEADEFGFYTYFNTGQLGTLPLDENEQQQNEKIFKEVEQMPRFPSEACEAMEQEEARENCAQTAFIKYLYTNIQYPADALKARVQGIVVVQFIVQKDGQLSDFKIARNIGGGCGAEALRIMKKMNSDSIRWIAGVENGKKVAVQYTVPVKFKLTEEAGEVFRVVEQMPRFPSEDCEALETADEKHQCSQAALLEYLFKNVKYPKIAKDASVEGTCVVQFTVEKDGSLSDIEVVRDVGTGLGDETRRVVEQMNIDNIKWIAGVQRGRKVRVRFTLPIKFKLSDDETTTAEQQPAQPDFPIATDQKLTLKDFELAPNPNNGEMRIRFQAYASPIVIRVYDAKGSLIYTESIANFSGSYNEQLELESASKGIHFLTIEQAGKTFVRQVVIE